MGRRLPRDDPRPSGARRHAAGRDRGSASRLAAGVGGTDGGDFRRFRAHDTAGHDPLAASALFCLFPGQRGAGLRHCRIPRLGDGRAMHALADIAGCHRTRDADDRLDASGAGPSGPLRRRNPGFGVLGNACRSAYHAGEGARLGRQSRGTVRQAGAQGLLLGSGSHLDRPGNLDFRHRGGEF